MLVLDNIHKSFATKDGIKQILNGISFTVAPKEIVGIIGRSGAGKSTLLKVVNLLEVPDSGEVKIAGKSLLSLDVPELRLMRQSIGMIFQHFNLYNSRTVWGNIAMPLEFMNFTKAEITARVSSMLEFCNLQDLKDSYPSALSGGQKQRVSIARALAIKPKILLCDEMTSALDPESTEQVLQLVKKVNIEFGIAVLLITHEMEVIKKIAERVLVLSQGEVVESNNVAAVFAKPQHSVTQELIRSCMHMELPEYVQQHQVAALTADSSTLIRITFAGNCAEQPIIDAMCKQYNIKINILQANMEQVQQTTIGMLLLAIAATEDEASKAIVYLQQQGLQVEELGYVRTANLGS